MCSKIANRQLVKRQAHDDWVQKAKAQLSQISESIEAKVLEASFRLKASLEDADAAIRDVSAQMQKNDVLVRQEVCYLHESWTKIKLSLEARRSALSRFASELEALELERAECGGGALKHLAVQLQSIAYRTLGEIERHIEAEAHELNTVIIANRRSHAELVAMLETKDVQVCEHAITQWREGQEAWRRLRHDRAVREFGEQLHSQAFTNPAERSVLFEVVKQRQAEMDDRRRALLEELVQHTTQSIRAVRCSRKTETKCNTEENELAARIKQGFKEIADLEDEFMADYERQLTTLSDSKTDEAKGLREALRAELHEYGALAEEPELSAPAVFLQKHVVQNPDLDAFFRSAGGLKAELRELIRELRDSEHALIYNHHLETAKKRLQTLLCGVDVAAMLERQGKSQQLMSLRDTLERLRKAGKRELLPLLAPLEQQLETLANVGGLDELLSCEMRTAVTDLRRVTRDLEFRGGASSRASARSGRSSNNSAARSSSGRSGATSTTNKTASRVSSAMSSTLSDPVPEVNMIEIRAVQKRVAMHMYTCDLDSACVMQMRKALQGLDQKAVCNERVDDVVVVECESLIDKRVAEYAELRHHCLVYLEHQASEAYERSCRICDFFGAATKLFRTALAKEHQIDEKMLDDLYELRENFQEVNTDLERGIEESCHALRHAADERELENHFQKLVTLLGRVEAQYREYHVNASTKTSQHPSQVADHLAAFQSELCGIFSLCPAPDKAADDIESDMSTFKASSKKQCYKVLVPVKQFIEETLFGGSPQELASVQLVDAAESRPVTASTQRDTEEAQEVLCAEPQTEEEQLFWIDGFKPLTDEQEEELDPTARERYLDIRALKLRRYDDDEFDVKLPVDSPMRATYLSLKAAIEKHQGERDAQEAASVAAKCNDFLQKVVPPVDLNGQACAIPENVPSRTEAATMLVELRETLVSDMELRGEARRMRIDKLTAARLNKLTEELEERLRTHWPRKGRSEVSFRQPREGELIMHRQRRLRHARLVNERNVQHTAECKQSLKAAVKHVTAFVNALGQIEVLLPEQTTHAGLQGLESKCKRLVSTFQREAQHHLHRVLEQYTSVEPSKLFALNDSMLKATRLFVDGGDYSDIEAEELKGHLLALRRDVEAAVQQRRAACEGLEEKQRGAVSLVENFKRRAQDCLQELSLREGLGQKYGAPRRNAQEKFRTEQTQDEARANALDALLSKLEALCRAACDQEEASSPRTVLDCLRDIAALALNRVAYLDCLAATSPKRETLRTSSDDEPVATGKETLAETVESVLAQCRQQTLDLYQREGVAFETVPESLEDWLAEARKRVMGEGGYRERAARRLRAQIHRLERLVAKTSDPDVVGAPTAAIKGLAIDAKRQAEASRSEARQSMSTMLEASLGWRRDNQLTLRPALARRPVELDALCASESARIARARASIIDCKSTVCKDQEDRAVNFVRSLDELARSLVNCLDALIFVEDLGKLPGDEYLQTKRKSLKRLRKAQRIADAKIAKGQDPSEDDATRNWPGLDTSPFFETAGVELSPSWASLVEEVQRPIPGYVTTAHRVLMKARNATFSDFATFFADASRDFDANCAHALESEATWEQNWIDLVESLRQSDPESYK